VPCKQASNQATKQQQLATQKKDIGMQWSQVPYVRYRVILRDGHPSKISFLYEEEIE
jgi:hypothetical protein